jgi:GNAT superfamily N-acetyltransferase
MTIDIVISDMPANSIFAQMGARWAFDDWKETDSNDDMQWYLNVYSESEIDPSSLPISLAAITANDELAGVACVVDDDALPDAQEPGPWVAAVFVNPEYRGRAVGKQLVTEAVRRARELGHSDVYLYTRDVAHWYETFGWERVRETHIHNKPITIMVNRA